VISSGGSTTRARTGRHALKQICDIYEAQGYETLVLAASRRDPMHVVESARCGVDNATVPYDVFRTLGWTR
jgi:transaldolase